MRTGLRKALIWLLALAVMGVTRSLLAAPVPPGLVQEARGLLGEQAQDLPPLRTVTLQGDTLTVCLEVDPKLLAEDGWMGMEWVGEEVRSALMTLAWQTLSVRAWDAEAGVCRPLSDYAPTTPAEPAEISSEVHSLQRDDAAEIEPTASLGFAGSLTGKTVYISAGHGWFWNGSAWRTQRPVYQGFIEDHNNAEAVAQYLIPYLENAGATVIPVRERDWSTARVIADNDTGAPTYTEWGIWTTGVSGSGYDGGTYRFAVTNAAGALTARATWSMSVPAAGDYAVYAWVYPGTNRVRDAHYTIHHAGGATELTLDQSIHPQTWRYLGTFPFHAGTATVMLDNRSSDPTERAVIADAIRLGSGNFDSLVGLPLLAPATPYIPRISPTQAPNQPWWESSTFYWSQWMGLDPAQWEYYNDVVARPMMSRWYQRASGDDAVFISWHTNGYDGTVRGTETYVHNGDTYPRTAGSTELQAAIHSELIADIRAGWDPAWPDRNPRSANLGELRMLYDPDYAYASLPGVLLEIAFHDNPIDANALKEPAFNELAARAVTQGIIKYFGQRDGVNLVLPPEPPTHLRVENVGGGAVRVSWAPSPVDGIGGAAATAYRVSTSPDGFAWKAPVTVAGTSATLSGLAAGQTVYARVTAINAGGESFPTEVLGARVGEPLALLVNGFDKLNRFELVQEVDPVEGANLRMWIDRMNSRRYIVHHGGAIPGDVAWDGTSNEAVARGDVRLGDYGIVIWMLGEESSSGDGSFNATERDLLTAYLSSGKSLMVSGSEFGWDLYELGRDPTFLTAQLHVNYVADDAGTRTARPVAGTAFAGLPDLHFDDPDEYWVGYPDVFAPASGAQTALTYVGATTPGAAAVQFASGAQRLLVFGFPFETLRKAEREPVMAAALDFLSVAPTETSIDVPSDGAGYSAVPTFGGKASGYGLSSVQLQLERGADGAMWTGASWSAAESWFGAYGTETWLYTMPVIPPLADGAYTLRARSVAFELDDSPAQSAFWIDRVAPATPTVVTPTAGVLITGPMVALQWWAPPDTGSPVAYEVDVDGRVRVFDASPAIVPVGLGEHAWRVRAVDLAGNVSVWSAWHSFEVWVEQAFLPLVTR
jgi:N-acetylmuramoyl-L-alanine amidase